MAVGIKGGSKLKRRLEELAENLRRTGQVRVGFLENATYPDGTLVAQVAAQNEFGAVLNHATIPSRPFFRNMIAKYSTDWPAEIAILIVKNEYDSDITMLQMGERIAGQLRQSIIDLVEPPLAPSTIARKGFDKPLIDTGHMLNSVDYELVKDDTK